MKECVIPILISNIIYYNVIFLRYSFFGVLRLPCVLIFSFLMHIYTINEYKI